MCVAESHTWRSFRHSFMATFAWLWPRMRQARSRFSRGDWITPRKKSTHTFNGLRNSIAPSWGAKEGNSMDHPRGCICAVWLVGVVSAQTVQQGPTRTTPAVLVTSATSRAQLEPVILTRASLDEKVITLRLAPRVATSIRMPEPVNSVVVGEPRQNAEQSQA